ncbi:MAG: PEP-CTERM sorting domain-containing protein [Fimbriimonadaceae bacterium]|nr:MAG: PEP-CTERM sorting domain-containing protein [Fimbriimonadaceae bacterium]
MKFLMRSLILASTVGLAVMSQAQFTLFATETQSGSLGGNTSLWKGVQQFNFTGTGGGFSMGPGLAPGSVNDPSGVEVVGNQVYISNRHGNQSGIGSIQRFNWDGTGLNFDISLTGNGLQQVHGAAISSTTGELFSANKDGGVSRFLPSGGGFTANGTFNNGDLRDVLVSSDGTKLYQTTPSNFIRVTEIATGATTNFTVNGSNAMHQMQMLNGDLYVTSFNSGTVHKVILDANFMPVSSSVILNVNSAIGIVFSPDGQEMFVSGHTSNMISRFLNSGGTWVANGQIDAGTNLGQLGIIQTVPEPGTMALLVVGLTGLAAKRRRKG